MKQIINGADFRRLVINAAANIENNKQHLNELNVFPVPDGDTGTNMSMTINAASADLRKVEDPSLEKAAKTAASAMLRGARGNSGVILSLLMRGISNTLKGKTEADGVLWAQALQGGVDAAYKAVMKPAEGTILTVARLAAAKAAEAARENNHIEFVHDAAIAGKGGSGRYHRHEPRSEEGRRGRCRRQGLAAGSGGHGPGSEGRGYRRCFHRFRARNQGSRRLLRLRHR